MEVPPFDGEDCVERLVELLDIPSPVGYTEAALAAIEGHLRDLGVAFGRTPKGALRWTLAGGAAPARAVAVHVDTLGAMVKAIKPSGRLRLTNLGGYDWATIEGAECLVHRRHGPPCTGTVVNVKQSTHVHGPELRALQRTEAVMELRLDEVVESDAEVRELGVSVGDPVSFVASPRRTDSGFVKARHLDNKAGVAIALAATRTLVTSKAVLPGDVHVFVSNYEEVGHGAAYGIPDEVEELVVIDMAAVGEGQTSRETHVTLCAKDAGGPYDLRLGRALQELAEAHGIDLLVDLYPYYSSDATAAWRAGGRFRAALIGPGVDASHSYERTHVRALDATGRLLLAYLVTPPASA
jgi:putative aminopeptidase FrvX